MAQADGRGSAWSRHPRALPEPRRHKPAARQRAEFRAGQRGYPGGGDEGPLGLLRAVRERGFRVVLASSAPEEHLEHYLDLLDARSVADGWTSADDVAETKPAPDLLSAAVDKVGGGVPIMVGDSTWDFLAAHRAGYLSYAVRTGGYSEQELREAGAARVFESLAELHDRLDETAFAGRSRP